VFKEDIHAPHITKLKLIIVKKIIKLTESDLNRIVGKVLLEQSSYDKDLVRKTIRMAEDDGNLEWWNGREIDRDYGDGETVDSGFVRGSIEEV
jgi:hypothetical protein